MKEMKMRTTTNEMKTGGKFLEDNEGKQRHKKTKDEKE
jgi:hypothetical protein